MSPPVQPTTGTGSTPSPTPTQSAPTSGTQGQAAPPQTSGSSTPRPVTPPRPTASSGSSGPASSSISGDTSSVYIQPFVGFAGRTFGSQSQDAHEGWLAGFRLGYPTLQLGSNFQLRPELLWRHEWMRRSIPAEMGQGIESSADIDVLGIGARFSWLAHQWFGVDIGFNVGAAHVGAEADITGHRGLRYGNNRFAYSADNWAFNIEGNVGVRIPEQRLTDWLALGGGADFLIGGTFWDLTPDSISRPASDPAVPVNSVVYGGVFYLSGRFGDVGSPRRAESEDTPRQSTPPPQTAPTPETPPTETAPTAPTAPQTPPAAQSSPRVDRVRFDVTPGANGSVQAVNSPANFTTFFNGIAGSERVQQAMAAAGSTGFVLNLRVRYTNQTRGTIEVESIRIGETTHRNGHFPADMAVSSTVIQSIVQAVVEQGLPGYTGNRQQPLRVQITHAAPASTSPDGTPRAVVTAR